MQADQTPEAPAPCKCGNPALCHPIGNIGFGCDCLRCDNEGPVMPTREAAIAAWNRVAGRVGT